jgi:phage terminase large subunit GpA-like protein
MDACSDPETEHVCFMKSAQTGGTEIINNLVGFHIDQDAAPMLLVQPTLDMAKAWSKDRLAPMLRDTPALRGKVKDPRSRDADNTVLHKVFPGGHVTMAGANSPASLASRPVRVTCFDEVDRYPPSAGPEGDPVNLGRKRSTTFWNRFSIEVSTPTVKGASRIEQSYNASTMEQYFVPCPHCDEHQVLKWAHCQWPDGEPALAYYACEHCGGVINDEDKAAMLAAGEWRGREPDRAMRGFHINELYSPWVTFGEMAVSFVEAKKFPETLKTWVNTALGETWEEQGDSVALDPLLARRETYAAPVPAGVCLLTAGVDVQDDRLEIEVVGYGIDQESWGIATVVLHGDPAHPLLWNQLDQALLMRYEHELGLQLPIGAVGIDTGGHFTQEVYRFCKPRFRRRVYALKGVGGGGKPLVGRPSRSNSGKVRLFPVGVDTGKDLLFGRLKIDEPGPGYCHFPVEYDDEYFRQLTSEHCITRFVQGIPHRAWVLKTKNSRNEALDCRNYANAALDIVSPNFELLRQALLDRAAAIRNAPPGAEMKQPAAVVAAGTKAGRRGRRVLNKGIG